MSLYRRTDTGEVRDLDPTYVAQLPEAKQALWQAYTAPEISPSADAIYQEQLALGYVDQATGHKLKTTESAQGKFTSQVTLLQLAVTSGAIAGSTPIAFWDFEDAEQSLPLSDFFGLMLRYGMHCQALFAEYAP